MTHGLYSRLGYAYAHAIDDGQHALVAGRPATVQNSYAPSSERGNVDLRTQSVERRTGLARQTFDRLEKFRRHHRRQRPSRKRHRYRRRQGRLRVSRNSFVGPDYASTDLRLSRKLYARNALRLELTAESFNLFKRLNRRYQITDDGLMSNQAQFNYGTKKLGINYFPAYYQVPTNFMKATTACAPRQIRFALRLGF